MVGAACRLPPAACRLPAATCAVTAHGSVDVLHDVDEAVGRARELPVSRPTISASTGLTFPRGGKPIGMSNSNMDQAKGRIKQAAGDLTDNDDLKREGKVDEATGKVKGAVDDVADKAGDAADKVKDKLTGN